MANTTTDHSAHGDGTHADGLEAIDLHAAESGAGMPQLDFGTFDNQIFWLLIALVAVYLILSRVALPRIGGVLAERQGTITNDIAAAEELKLKAEQAEAAYEKALSDARSEANAIAEKTKADIQSELDIELSKADEAIAAQSAEAEKAIADIQANATAVAKEAAVDTAQAIVTALGGAADQADIEAAVNERIKG